MRPQMFLSLSLFAAILAVAQAADRTEIGFAMAGFSRKA